MENTIFFLRYHFNSDKQNKQANNKYLNEKKKASKSSTYFSIFYGLFNSFQYTVYVNRIDLKLRKKIFSILSLLFTYRIVQNCTQIFVYVDNF